jgi:hypothetical protein
VRARRDNAAKAARSTIDGATHTTRPAACSQDQSYRSIDIRDRDGQVESGATETAALRLHGTGLKTFPATTRPRPRNRGKPKMVTAHPQKLSTRLL